MKKYPVFPQITIEACFSPIDGAVVKRPRSPESAACSMFYSPEFEIKTERNDPADPVKSEATFAFRSMPELIASILSHLRGIGKEIGCKPSDIHFEITSFKAELPEQKRKAKGYESAISRKDLEQLHGVTAVFRTLVYDLYTLA
jgi:hypothetical protein